MRRFLILSARMLVSLASLYLALRGINFAAIESRLSQISLGWIGLAVQITVIQIFIGAPRWREISALCQAPADGFAGLALQHDRLVLQSDAAVVDRQRGGA